MQSPSPTRLNYRPTQSTTPPIQTPPPSYLTSQSALSDTNTLNTAVNMQITYTSSNTISIEITAQIQNRWKYVAEIGGFQGLEDAHYWFEGLWELYQHMNVDNNRFVQFNPTNLTLNILIKPFVSKEKLVQIAKIKLQLVPCVSKSQQKNRQMQLSSNNNLSINKGIFEQQNVRKCLSKIQQGYQLDNQDIKLMLKYMGNKLIHVYDNTRSSPIKAENQLVAKQQIEYSLIDNVGQPNKYTHQIADNDEIRQNIINNILQKLQNIKTNINQLAAQRQNKINAIYQKIKISNKMHESRVRQLITKFCRKKQQYQGHIQQQLFDDNQGCFKDGHFNVITNQLCRIGKKRHVPNSYIQAQKQQLRVYDQNHTHSPNNQNNHKPKIQQGQVNIQNFNTQNWKIKVEENTNKFIKQNTDNQDQININKYQDKLRKSQIKQQLIQYHKNIIERQALNGKLKMQDTKNQINSNSQYVPPCNIKNIKLQSDINVPKFIDVNSAYISFFQFSQNRITLASQPESYSRRSITIFGKNSIKQQNKINFKIVSLHNRFSISLGFVDQRRVFRRYFKADDQVVKISSRGFLFDGEKSQKVADRPFTIGDTVTMKALPQFGIVQWSINNKISYSCLKKNLSSPNVTWVPFIEMKRLGDCVEWIEQEINQTH